MIFRIAITGVLVVPIFSSQTAEDKQLEFTPEMAERWRLMVEQIDWSMCASEKTANIKFEKASELAPKKVAIGDSFDNLNMEDQEPNEDYHYSGFYYSAKLEKVSLRFGEEDFTFVSGGMGNRINSISYVGVRKIIHEASYDYHICPLTLEDTLARTAELEGVLRNQGFIREGNISISKENGITSSDYTVSNWVDIEADLGTTPRLVHSAYSEWRSGSIKARITIENWGADAPETDLEKELTEKFGSLSVFERDGSGRKYGVNIAISDDALFRRELDNAIE